MRHELACGTITNIHRTIGNNTDIIIATLDYKATKIDITYDCTTDRVLIHEWYRIASEELPVITEELRDYFNYRRKFA